MKIIMLFSLLISSIITSAFAVENLVGACSLGASQLINRDLLAQLEQLSQVAEASKERVDLVEASVSYGFLGIGVGKAKIYLTISEGKIVDLNVDAKVGILGINSDIKQKVTIDRLKRGQPLEFFLEGARQPSLRIRPGTGFSETGGTATIEIWDGEEYKKETISISSSLGNKYKVYQGNVARTNEVTGVKINMRGMNISDMYVGSYKIETR
ncbi:MAG: hypothetical protein COW01_13120 [Bdellovibrionales bacterium CG12_big_fil_rev_8_21_14_0_65_38_15]|nr:MAG: hypothetical protein COW79_06110 [Bdellovibrionales bacterium CG22_combo_CG10-13_8_21_14_all_38_13]PIQ53563.1 MAG: hypothetical protein COW01_13120 [Bdellovibrionales bacterium CG12_big_fil_rev_8_21_14_0_65_38_15]PIR28433.1 MAG: hypothetical protein COV38_15520 [Bdellovibrionales bacterium CG11_big_fil_rev_8_21_14_0_20_38_13]